jgi:hypothetical protein
MVFFFGGEGDSAQGERKGRLGKSYVDVACGDWGESLWSGAMIGICVEGSSKGRMAHGRHGNHRQVSGLGGFFGI